jgi:hypothetical protein
MTEKKEEFSLKNLKFTFNLADADYQIDALQNELLLTYLRADSRFRRAFSRNYTNLFLRYLKDKARLREPVHISMLGVTRSGKSYSAISIATFLMACYGKKFGIEYICGNAIEFLEKLKSMSEEELINSCFLIDEEKNYFGYGSIAKKMKIQDTQNIIAINNISTIMLNPISWQNKDAYYGLRLFGKCYNTKTCRLMLYNLQEKGKGGELPMGCLFLPIFTAFLPKDFAEKLEKQYLEKKKIWVKMEMRGENDVLAELRKKSAESFVRDKIFIQIKKKKEKLTYIMNKMGSEWTSHECEDILNLASLLQQGFLEESK